MDNQLNLWPTSLSDTTSFLGVTIFCFDICSLAFPVEESMRHKHQFGRAVVWSLVFVWFVYVLLGDMGALLYVQSESGIRDNILSNLPVDSFVALVVRLAMTAVSRCYFVNGTFVLFIVFVYRYVRVNLCTGM